MGKVHWLQGSRSYKSWCSMKQRCHNENHNSYHRYGWRWIFMCDEWKNDFMTFYNDMWERPEWRSLDRINNDLWYFKENCRWATSKEQQNNTRKNVKCEFRGTIYSIEDFAILCGLWKATVRYRMWDWLSCEEIYKYAEDLHNREIEIAEEKRKREDMLIYCSIPPQTNNDCFNVLCVEENEKYDWLEFCIAWEKDKRYYLI